MSCIIRVTLLQTGNIYIYTPNISPQCNKITQMSSFGYLYVVFLDMNQKNNKKLPSKRNPYYKQLALLGHKVLKNKKIYSRKAKK